MFSTQKILVSTYHKKSKVAEIWIIPLVFHLIFITSFVTASSADSSTQLHQSSHYRIHVDFTLTLEQIESVSKQLENNYELFTSLFSVFLKENPAENRSLNIRYLGNKEKFDNTLAQNGVPYRKSFIYLGHRKNPKERALYIYPLDNARSFASQLGRHSFFSYIFDILPTIPTWIREGLALCYSNVNHQNDFATVSHNKTFLDDLRKVAKKNPLDLSDLMQMTDESGTFKEQNFERNFLYAWGLIHFLVFSGHDQYLSVIKQAIGTLSLSNSQIENSRIMSDYLRAKLPNLESEFQKYIFSQPSNTDILKLMDEAYQKRDYETAKNYAQDTLTTMPNSFIPVYYLGLIAFAKSDFSLAKKHYQDALKKNAPPALIDFCMGYLSYYGEKDPDLAISFFQNAKKKDPQIRIKAEKMIKIITENKPLHQRLSN